MHEDGDNREKAQLGAGNRGKVATAEATGGGISVQFRVQLTGRATGELGGVLSFIYKPLHAARRAMAAACRCL